MPIDLSRFQQTFFEETAEHLANLESGLLRLEETPGDGELLNSIFRAAHSVKGGAGMLGFEAIQTFTHSLENLLDRLRSGGMEISPPVTALLFESVDTLRGLVGGAVAEAELSPEAVAVKARIEEMLALGQGAPRPGSKAGPPEPGRRDRWKIRFSPAREAPGFGLDPLLALRDLAALGGTSIRADRSKLPPLETLDPEPCHLAWVIELETGAGRAAIDDCFCFWDGCAEIGIEKAAEEGEPAKAEAAPGGTQPPVRPAGGPEQATIRVPTAKVDQVIDLIGELVISQSMVAQSAHNLQTGKEADFEQALEAFRRQTRELQERVMSLRMVPAGTVFGRFPRVVRDLAVSMEKEIRLEVSGEETEIDRALVEGIADPLTHLVRNSADHGLEPPAERVAAGKPAEGTIRLCARHEGGKVVIEIGDDGRGLDAAKIRAKAIERGLISRTDSMPDGRIAELIFEPGFSTAERVTDLSGRGVGMDVVRRNIESLGGAAGIATERGKGTTVRIELPLTLAILDGLLLKVHGIAYVLPLASVVESIDPAPGQWKTMAGLGEVLLVRGTALPAIRLRDLLPRSDRADGGAAARPLAVVVEAGKQRCALVVDEIAGQRQFVVKSLDRNYRRVEGALGATILGDGRVALILDVPGLARLAARRHGSRGSAAEGGQSSWQP